MHGPRTGARNPEHRERYDLAVARAVAPLPVLCELMLPFVAVGGRMLCYKGPAAQDELEAGGRAARMLGGGALEVLPADVPGQPTGGTSSSPAARRKKPLDNIPEKPAHPAVLRWEWGIQKNRIRQKPACGALFFGRAALLLSNGSPAAPAGKRRAGEE